MVYLDANPKLSACRTEEMCEAGRSSPLREKNEKKLRPDLKFSSTIPIKDMRGERYERKVVLHPKHAAQI